VANQALVDHYYSDKDAIGQVIQENAAKPEWMATIVGMVPSVQQWGPTYPPLGEWYTPYRMRPFGDSHLVVRSTRAPEALIPAIQQEILKIDKDLPLSSPRTMKQVLGEATRGDQFLLTMVSAFAGIAVLLAMAGIFGTMAYNVAQRTREIGVRVAFGAHQRRILTMVLREGLILSAVGTGVGAVLLLVFSGILRSQLYGVGPLNLVYAGIAVVLLVTVTMAATALPALRASRVDPMQSLRFE
jgi:predicted lysophospholipase L1 biosynthesis ABC-type transport system permease subunit